jgi:hypothetical protein
MMTDCQTAREQWELTTLSRSTDGDHSSADVTSHLESCSNCRIAFREQKRFDEEVADRLADVPVPAGLKDRLRQRLGSAADLQLLTESEAIVDSPKTGARRRSWRRFGTRTISSIAALLLIAAVVWTLQPARLEFRSAMQVATADWSEFTTTAEGTILPVAWTSQPGMAVGETRSRQVSVGLGRTVMISATPFRWASRRPSVQLEGRLVQMPATAVRPLPAANSFTSATIEYQGADAWVSWVDGDQVYICFVPQGAASIEHLQRAFARQTMVT